MLPAAAEAPVRIGFENILLATDFSQPAKAALKLAAAYARRHNAKLWITHVVLPPPRQPIPIEAIPMRFDPEWVTAEQDLEALDRSSVLNGIPHQVELHPGELWPVLENLIARHHIDAIVMGTHGREGVSKLLLGSVAEEVVHLAACPVITVGCKAVGKAASRDPIEHILYATDFRAGSLQALDYAFWLARENRARLTMLHALELPSQPDLSEAQWKHADAVSKLVDLIPRSGELGCIPECLVEFGDPADIILGAADEKNSDLIVLGARTTQHPYAASHLGGGIAHRVLAEAACPVLTVRG